MTAQGTDIEYAGHRVVLLPMVEVVCQDCDFREVHDPTSAKYAAAQHEEANHA